MEGWKPKWDLKKANWIEYCRELRETFPGEAGEEGWRVSRWEGELKEHLKRQAKKSVGLRRFKVGKIRLKGWWDEEVAQAVGDRKRENRKQRNLGKLAREKWREI